MQRLRPIFLSSFFFSIHLALVAYINSSVLGSVLTPRGVSIVFTISSLLSLLLVLEAPRMIKRTGNVRYMATVLGVSAICLFLLGLASGHLISALIFIPYFALSTLIFYGFDIFLEHFSKERATGGTRGTYMTLNNLAWVGMPAIVGTLETHYGFGIVYFLAGCAVLAALATLFTAERRYHDLPYAPVSLRKTFQTFRHSHDVRGSLILAWLLQLFYAWMVVYSPFYLIEQLGLSWQALGIVFSVMLLPFVLLEYPTGRLADRFSNERELVVLGFLIMGVATIIFSLVGGVGALAIALILFLTRVGASIVEVSNESYFFKHVTDHNLGLIGAYRNMAPLAYVLGPILAILFLGWGTYAALFFVLGILMLIGAGIALTLHDVKKKET